MTDELSHLIGLMDMAKVSAKVRRRNKERVNQGLCLCCDKAPWRRGLCIAHYAAFLRKRNSLSKLSRGKFLLECERKGLVLAPRESEQIRSKDPFKEIA